MYNHQLNLYINSNSSIADSYILHIYYNVICKLWQIFTLFWSSTPFISFSCLTALTQSCSGTEQVLKVGIFVQHSSLHEVWCIHPHFQVTKVFIFTVSSSFNQNEGWLFSEFFCMYWDCHVNYFFLLMLWIKWIDFFKCQTIVLLK